LNQKEVIFNLGFNVKIPGLLASKVGLFQAHGLGSQVENFGQKRGIGGRFSPFLRVIKGRHKNEPEFMTFAGEIQQFLTN